MRYEEAGPGRLFRPSEGWRPVGPVLPPLPDDDLHGPLRPHARGHWILPRVIDGTPLDVQPGDVLICQERMIRLHGRCGPHHPAWQWLRRMMHAWYPAETAQRCLDSWQVWSGRVLELTREER